VKRLFPPALALATALTLAFFLLPLVGLFTRTSPADVVARLGTSQARDALLVSLKTNAIAEALIVLLGRRPRICSQIGAFSAARSC